jgi:hypothetical protein
MNSAGLTLSSCPSFPCVLKADFPLAVHSFVYVATLTEDRDQIGGSFPH